MEKDLTKAIISNRIYLGGLTPEQDKNIKELLTYRLVVNGMTRLPNGKTQPTQKVDYLKAYKNLPRGVLSIPQARADLIPRSYEVVDKRVTNEVPFPLPKIQLRPGAQQEIYDSVVDSCFINAKVGFGKTFLALHIARKLGQKTLVICHTTALRDQWAQECEAIYGMSPGIIGSGKFDIEDHFLVVSNVQSLKKHITELSKEFGTIIVDEAHHTPATTFTELVDSFYARYRIGLSGTMERKDGKHALLTDFFSSTVYKPPQDNTLTPVVKIVKPGVFLDPKLQWSQKINKLLYDEDYQHFIANLAQLLINRGHCVLIIASRVEFLKVVNDLLGTQSLLVTGETSLEERQRTQEAINSSTAQAICGSRQIFSEGISVNRLSAVILAEPMSYSGLIEQIVGRIQRKHDDKLHPEVYDINFSDFASRKQNQDRLTFYLNQGWEVEQYQ